MAAKAMTAAKTYRDPSKGKGTHPVCFVEFHQPYTPNTLRYHGGKIRTYSPGKVDDRILPLGLKWCGDLVTLSNACVAGKGAFIAPVSVVKELLGYKTDRRFAKPGEHPGC
jgi:hypothetical protein